MVTKALARKTPAVMICILLGRMVSRTLKMILKIGNKRKGIGLRVEGLGGEEKSIFQLLPPNPYTLNPKKGLTLIEVLVAVSILAIGIGGVLQAFAGSVAALEAGQYNVDAVNVIKQKMADVQQMLFEQKEVSLDSENGTFEDFRWEWEIKPTDIQDLNELTLKISHAYNPRTFSVKTYVVSKETEE